MVEISAPSEHYEICEAAKQLLKERVK